MALVPGIFGFGGTRETKPELKLVPVRDIKANPPGRFRIDPAAVVRLAESIRVQGLIEPLLVRPFSGKYELVIGFRRLVAAVMAGMTTVPAVVV
ncbi:MAG: ParB N-terminal domain-containing protein, partial [Actinobacteria bacterium]|nr:ParB N-terminal domain-containing protein [Actinomycetota bacterium]